MFYTPQTSNYCFSHNNKCTCNAHTISMQVKLATCTILNLYTWFFFPIYPVNYKSNNYYLYHKFFVFLYTLQNIFIYNYIINIISFLCFRVCYSAQAYTTSWQANTASVYYYPHYYYYSCGWFGWGSCSGSSYR